MQEPSAQPQPLLLQLYWQAACRRKRLIISLTIIAALTTAVVSLFLPDIYEATAVITTATEQDGTSSTAMQILSSSGLANMADVAGLSLPGGLKLNELELYLKSNAVREKVIVQNHLLPSLLYEQWDGEKNAWKPMNPWSPSSIARSLRGWTTQASGKKPGKTDDSVPTVWDGLRAFDKMLQIRTNKRANTLTIAFDYPDPEIAAAIVHDMLETLQDYLSEQKKITASENKKYLQGQLAKAVDPLTRQKIYSLLSKQVETSLMAEVRGNIFKIIDPPKVPDRKVRPRRGQMVINSIVLSFVLGFFLAMVLEKRAQTSLLGRKEPEEAGKSDDI